MRTSCIALLMLLVILPVSGISPKQACEDQVTQEIDDLVTGNNADPAVDGNTYLRTSGCAQCADAYASCTKKVDSDWSACVTSTGSGNKCSITSEPAFYACANTELNCCRSFVAEERCGSLSAEEITPQGEGDVEEDCTTNNNIWINGGCMTLGQAHWYCQSIKSSRAYSDNAGNCQECARGSVFNIESNSCEGDRDCSSKSNSAWNENAKSCVCNEGFYESGDSCLETTRKSAGFPNLPPAFRGNLHQGESREFTLTFSPAKGTLLVRSSTTKDPRVTVSVSPSNLQITPGKRGIMKIKVTAASDLEEFTNDETTAILELKGSDEEYLYSGSVPIQFRILQGEAFEPDVFENIDVDKIDTSTSYGKAKKKIVDYVKDKGFGVDETNRIFKAINTLKAEDKDDLKLMILVGGVLIQKANEKNENPLPADLDMKKITDTIVKAVEHRAAFEKAYERYKKTVKTNLAR